MRVLSKLYGTVLAEYRVSSQVLCRCNVTNTVQTIKSMIFNETQYTTVFTTLRKSTHDWDSKKLSVTRGVIIFNTAATLLVRA